jgi:hypothetical protein
VKNVCKVKTAPAKTKMNVSFKQQFKIPTMKSARLSAVAIGMIACTHISSTDTFTLNDSMSGTKKSVNVAPVVNNKKPVVIDTPDLPLFRDVLDPKRLFW